MVAYEPRVERYTPVISPPLSSHLRSSSSSSSSSLWRKEFTLDSDDINDNIVAAAAAAAAAGRLYYSGWMDISSGVIRLVWIDLIIFVIVVVVVVVVAVVTLEIFLPLLPFFPFLSPFLFSDDNDQDKRDNSLASSGWGMISCKEILARVSEMVLNCGWDWIAVNGWWENSTLFTSYHQLSPPIKKSAFLASSNASFEQTDKADLPWNSPWTKN